MNYAQRVVSIGNVSDESSIGQLSRDISYCDTLYICMLKEHLMASIDKKLCNQYVCTSPLQNLQNLTCIVACCTYMIVVILYNISTYFCLCMYLPTEVSYVIIGIIHTRAYSTHVTRAVDKAGAT